MAWRYLGSDYRYVYFDIPLSCFEQSSAEDALCRAIEELLGNTTEVGEGTEENLPGSFGLSQNYPNPFNPTTEIRYSLPSRGHVNLSVYNILGQRVATLVDKEQPAGVYRVQWDGCDDNGQTLATGIYLYQIRTGANIESKKMLLLK